jgi:hypothetical protein
MVKRSWVAALVAAALCLAFAAPVTAAGHVRLFAGHDSVVDTLAVPTTCPTGASWRYSGAGTGQFLHLGRTSVAVTHCTFVDMTSGTGSFGPGTITLTAANGDELHLVHRGTFRLVDTPEGLTSVFNMSWVVVGGTGRYEAARGSGMTHGSSLLSTGTTAATYLGLIRY